MAAKDEIPTEMLTPRSKDEFLKDFSLKHKDLGKCQREYKKILSTRLKTRSERILDKSFVETIARLESERNDLRAQIWVANGSSHKMENEKYLNQIQCHIRCQERLGREIKDLKVLIDNMEYEISRVDKEIYDLNCQTVPDSQYQDYVAHMRKRLSILENRLEVGVRRECGFTALNAALREEIKTLLDHRTYFNTSYSKLIQQLNMDKKYLTDLLEYAFTSFEGGISINEKISITKNKIDKEREQAKVEMQGIMRKIAADELVNGFMNCKSQLRNLAHLQPKEYRRREEFKRKHVHQINVYNTVLEKIYRYTDTHNVDAVIDKFEQHQSLYYSFYNYTNETSFHMTLLNNEVNRLFNKVTNLEEMNRKTFSMQQGHLSVLKAKLGAHVKRNSELNAKLMAKEKKLDHLYLGIATVFNMCHADVTPLMFLLGNHNYVDLHNVRGFLKILEKRISDIVMNVFIMERDNDPNNIGRYVVKELEKVKEIPTNLDDIVLTQQCAECAEGETLNIEEGGDTSIRVLSIAEIKKLISEKVNQPEMQYRLHNISQCRLPRSRLLAAKRFM